MTRKEFFQHITDGTITDEVIKYAATELARFNAQEAQNDAANAQFYADILELVDKAGAITAPLVRDMFGISVQKATGLLIKLVNKNELVATNVIMNRRVLKQYSRIE